jgi:hypothetical protein
MMVRRFKQVFMDDDGQELVYYCVAFDSEQALEQALAGQTETRAPAEAPEHIETEPRPRGRPSYRAELARAIEVLGPELDPELPLAERRRRVLRYLAQSGANPEDIPSRSTTETYLATHQLARKPARKSPRKSQRRKLVS